MRQLAKSHAQKLFPASELFHFKIAIVPFDQCLKLLMRNKTYQLRENIFALVHKLEDQWINKNPKLQKIKSFPT
jgi:hypothetical protein